VEKKLSIVIISKDTKDLLKDLLGSIYADTSLTHSLKEIILVDNGSVDGTDRLIEKSFPKVVYLRNEGNMGFAAAVNRGFVRSYGEYVFLLNSDTRLIEGEALKMLLFLEENRDVGICGPQLVYPDMKPQRSFAYVPSLFLEIVPRFILELLFPEKYAAKQSSHFHAPVPAVGRVSRFTLHGIIDVPSLIGAAIMIRRSVFDALDGFDERFFFFLEETDLCVRAKGIGRRVVFLPDAKVVHLQGKTVGKNWVKGRIEYNISLYKFIRKHRSLFYLAGFTSVRFIKNLISLVLYSILAPFSFRPTAKRVYAYHLSLFLWHLKGCPEKAGLRENALSGETD
jgi:N-acetylglucosaminyl-diphospho-decaprenol L-rhamnosyltransferase